ncbi:MAG: hypothetical protein M3333_03305 [Actinomycetota bacterium]|nr:hypothetical protein [Actinomycetota bacterium]
METVTGTQSETEVDASIETPPSRWAPASPGPGSRPPETILFTDGVRRVDASVWIEDSAGTARPAICASYSAGAVRCHGRAEIVAAEVRRGLFCSPNHDAAGISTRYAHYPVCSAGGDAPEQLSLALQLHMGRLEVTVAECAPADLIVVDGPLTGRLNIPGAVGYVKTHHVAYLPPDLHTVVGKLESGQRTPVFMMTSSQWSKFSWYVRLPGPAGSQWAGVIRCESNADLEVKEVVELADSVTAMLPRFASAGHKDPRAPQNLYPIAGLERQLRRRMGDPALLYRGLREAAMTLNREGKHPKEPEGSITG